MIALMIFTLVMTGFAYGLQQSLAVTRDNRLRTQASQLAARELEIVRNEFTSSSDAPAELGATSVVVNPHPLPGGAAGAPLRQDGTDFTVTRSVQWLPAGTGRSACDGDNPEVTYPSLAVNVTVTWLEHDNVIDLQNNTVLTPEKGTLTGTMGFIAAKVVGASGKGVPGLPVTVTGGSGTQVRNTVVDAEDTTGDRSGGCAVFLIASPPAGGAGYTVTLNQPGYRGYDGLQATSKTVTVTPGSIQVVPFSYDAAATLTLTTTTAPGWDLPVPRPPVTLFNPSLPPTGTKVLASGSATSGGLWPYPDGYTGWAGSCADNDPAAGGGTRPAPVLTTPGSEKVMTLPLTPVTASVVDGTGAPLAGRIVVAEMTTDTNPDAAVTTARTCGVYALGISDADGQVKSSLPAGEWWLRLATDGTCPATPVPETVTMPETWCARTPLLTGDLTPVTAAPIVIGAP